MKFSLLIAVVASFAAVGVVQAETPSLRRLDEPAANTAAANEPSVNADTMDHSEYCDRHPFAPTCDHVKNPGTEERVGSDYCDRHPFAPICDRVNADRANPSA